LTVASRVCPARSTVVSDIVAPRDAVGHLRLALQGAARVRSPGAGTLRTRGRLPRPCGRGPGSDRGAAASRRSRARACPRRRSRRSPVGPAPPYGCPCRRRAARRERTGLAPVALQEIDAPQRLGPVEWRRDEVGHELLQRAPVTRCRDAATVDMQIEVEAAVVLTCGGGPTVRRPHVGASAESSRPCARAARPASPPSRAARRNHSTELMTIRLVGRSICSQAASAVDIPFRGDCPSGVQLVDAVAVALGDHAALDLQRRRELSGGLAEVVVEDREALDLLDARQPLVDGVDRGL
jgi:hypothetical protein